MGGILFDMTNLEKIENEIAALPEMELRKFADWFAEFQEQMFDKRIEKDVKSGKLDNIAKLAIAAHRNGENNFCILT